jgi:hypothetical protein
VVILADSHAKGNGNEIKIREISTEIQRMWNMKCMFIPVIMIGATGLVEKGLKKNLEATPGKHLVDSPQNTVYWEHHTRYGKYCSLELEA